MSTMSSFKSCVSRLHDVLTLRRNKKTKSRLVIVRLPTSFMP